MDEHNDDLESVIHENAEEEVDTFPDTSDELEDDLSDDQEDEEELDEDRAELQDVCEQPFQRPAVHLVCAETRL